MARNGVSTTASATLFWRLAFVMLLAACIGLGALIWESGRDDTKRAQSDGRRLVVTIETGKVEGGVPPPKPDKPADAHAESSPSNPSPAASNPEVVLSGANESKQPEPIPAVMPADQVPEGAKAELLSPSSDGPLPVISPDGARAWEAYAKSYQRSGRRPMIALVVEGLGQSKLATGAAIRLPENVTLSFNPYARELTGWIGSARAGGHETMLDLPLEPSDYPAADPGPHGLLRSATPEANEKHLRWVLSRAVGYVGVVMPQGEGLSASDAAMEPILRSVNGRGLMLAVGREPARAETKQLLEASGVTAVVADVWVDEELAAQTIMARLATLERLAHDRGYAVGVAQPFPMTMKQLAEWTARLDAQGIDLVPLTFIAKHR